MASDVETVIRDMILRIDAEIAELQVQRVGAQAILARLSATAPAPNHQHSPAPSAVDLRAVSTLGTAPPLAFTKNEPDVIEQTILAANPEVHVRQIEAAVRASGVVMTPEQIRSRISYLNRSGRIENGHKRGWWKPVAPTNTSGPASGAGPEASAEPVPRGGDATDGQASHNSDRKDVQ